MTERRLSLLVVIGLVIGITLIPVAASAAQQTAEPAVLSNAWYWEDYKGEERDIQGNKVVVETTNPFCPSTPGSTGAIPGTCAEGRLPVEVRGGDYQTPVMQSAVGFDLSMLVPGSEVSRFTVTFLEAESGCYSDDGQFDPAGGDHCEQTNPVNIEGKQLQACLVHDIFGDAEARPPKEMPSFTCSNSDPVAERKEVKAVDKDTDADGVDHVWTFDLTPFAERWAEEFAACTCILITGKEPQNTGPNDSWRVVLAGPKPDKGIRTKLVYEPGELDFALPPPPPAGGDTTFSGGSTGGTSFGTGSTGFGAGGGGEDLGAAGDAGGEEPAPADDDGALASDQLPGANIQNFPGYMWLALLAGLIGFSLVRQVVIESATGIRPDGVLSKIHSLNAERRGALIDAAATPSAAAGIGAVFSALGGKVKDLTSKLPFTRRG